MARPDVLKHWQAGTRWLQPAGYCALVVALALAAPAFGANEPEDPELSPVAQQYRQSNLVLMVSEGVQPAFLAMLESQSAGETAAGSYPQVEVDDFQTPLNRIVDQRSLIRKAAQVFRYAQDKRPDITANMEALALSDPAEVAQVDLIQLAEDAIIIRTALTGNFEYLLSNGIWSATETSQEPDTSAIAGYLDTYRNRTLFLRNVMEYWEFEQELAAITDAAMDDTGGRMEAYQRMLEDEPNLDSFRQHLQAVEYIYWRTRGGEGKLPKLPGDELIEAESQVN